SGGNTIDSAVINATNAPVTWEGNGGFDNVTINDGAAALFPDAQQFGNLLMNGTGSAHFQSGGAANSILHFLNMSATAKIDLTDNDLMYDYTGSPSAIGSWDGTKYTGVAGLLQTGRNGGSWNGNGINTSAARGSLRILGLAQASQAL